jgi:hypothetical protein
MAKFDNPLKNLKIASPCSQDWDAMIGDDRKRFCGECKLNVYNLSGMTREEAENLIINSEGRLCVRFYRRSDGTILTEDCPVGWRTLKKRISRTAAAFVSMLFGLIGGLGLVTLFEKKKEEPVLMGTIPVSINKNSNAAQMGEIADEPQTFTNHKAVMGGIRPIKRTNEINEKQKKIDRKLVRRIVGE